MIKLKLTLTHEYEAEPGFYGTEDPDKMAQIDLDMFVNGGGLIEHIDFNWDDLNIDVEPVLENK